MAAQESELVTPYTLDAFVKKIKTLPAEEIGSIPLDQVPDHIPPKLFDKLPMATRGALENLVLEANAYHLTLHQKDLENYGANVVAAMDMANAAGKAANLKVFESKVVNLVSLLQEAQHNKNLDINLVSSNVSHINGLLMGLRTDNAALIRAMQLLESVKPAEGDQNRLQRTARKLHAKADGLGKALTEYYILRLKITTRAMLEKRLQIKSLEARDVSLRERINECKKQVAESQSIWRRAIKNRKAKEDFARLQDELSELLKKVKANEVVIEEKALTEWLDAIVDASLNEAAVERLGKRVVGDARAAIYILLQRYCQSQEDSAIQIAQNPFMQVDPQQAINFVLMSEQFILDYFATKRKDPSSLLSGAAQIKIEALDRLQKDILHELRRVMKLHGRK